MCIFIWWLAVPAKTMCWGVASSGKIKHLTMPPHGNARSRACIT